MSDNKPDAGGDPITRGQLPDPGGPGAAADDAPTTSEVAVQNLFYLNNVIHDTLYAAGFTEAAGNFQENNFGARQGDSDSVNAEAQDGGGIDNANFATPPDGVNPRMQMYLWTGLGTHQVVVHAAGGDVTYLAAGCAVGRPARHDRRDRDAGRRRRRHRARERRLRRRWSATTPARSWSPTVAPATSPPRPRTSRTPAASGIIVANNNGSAPFTMGGADASVTIPGVMVSQADGAAIKAAAGTSTTIKLADVAAADARRRRRLRRRVARVRSRPDLADDRQDERSARRRHRRGHGATCCRSSPTRTTASASTPPATRSGSAACRTTSTTAPTATSSVRRCTPTARCTARSGGGCSQHYQAAGIDKSVLLADLVDGMNYTPREPAFEDMRDGILDGLAASGNDERSCMVWDAFAEYGVGVGADGVAKGKRRPRRRVVRRPGGVRGVASTRTPIPSADRCGSTLPPADAPQ